MGHKKSFIYTKILAITTYLGLLFKNKKQPESKAIYYLPEEGVSYTIVDRPKSESTSVNIIWDNFNNKFADEFLLQYYKENEKKISLHDLLCRAALSTTDYSSQPV